MKHKAKAAHETKHATKPVLPETFDCIIVGGGMVGATLALLLADAGRQVAVLERLAPSTALGSQDSYELRVSALNRISQRLLQRVGVWDGVLAQRVSAYSQMRVWEAQSADEICFDAASLGEPDLGYIVENRALQFALQQRLQQHVNVSFLAEVEIETWQRLPTGIAIQLGDGQKLGAGLVVGADGAHSVVREWANIAMPSTDYAERGVVAVIKTELSHQATAWQRFLPTGPVAFLPLADAHHCSIVWTLPADVADWRVQQTSEQFIAALTEAVEQRLGALELVSPRMAFPLQGRHAEAYCAERMVLVGDAAHTIHPLAGQGVNLGLKDSAALAEAVAWAKDIGAMRGLRRYERARRADNALTLHAMEGFSVLFGHQAAWVSTMRNQGLRLLNRLEHAKGLLAKQALGI